MDTGGAGKVLRAIGAVLLLAASASALTLVKDGRPVSVIVMGNNPVPSQRIAAEDLQYHLKKMSGAVVPIVAEKDLGENPAALILLGQSDLLKSKGIDTAQLARETMIVKTLDNALVLAGEDGGQEDPYTQPYDSSRVRSGTFYAVADFLQDQLGVRWLWPGPSGEVIPKRQTIEVGALDIQETPQLFQRHYRLGGMGGGRGGRGGRPSLYMQGKEADVAAMTTDLHLWLKRMKMGYGQRFGYGHAYTQWFERYIETIPEVFAMQKDGHRGIPTPDYNKSFVKMCCSSDKLVDMLIEQYVEARKKNPDHRYLNAVENDGNGGFCQCEPCRALDIKVNAATEAQLQDLGWSGADIGTVFGEQSDGLPYSLSNRYFTFYNKLARRLHEVAPDAFVVAYAYDRYKFAPIDLKIEPNILVGLIGFNMYPANETDWNLQRENLLAWKKAGVQQLFFRPNSFAFSPAIGIPWNDVSQMAGDLKLLLDNGIVATDWDSLNSYWATAGQTYYVLTRQHWDVKSDPEELRQEYNLAFGPAADAVKAYWDHWEKVMIAAFTRPDLKEVLQPFDPRSGRNGRWNAPHVLLKQEDFDKGREFLKQARAAAEGTGDPDLLTRIEVLELGFRNGELAVKACAFAQQKHSPDADMDYTAHYPVTKEMYEIRDRLLRLRAHNVMGLNNADGTRYATRIAMDFYKRPFAPLMSPAVNKWIFAPDPADKGEAENWFAAGIPEQAALKGADGPLGAALFGGTWNRMAAVTKWKESSGKASLPVAWYQIEISPAAANLPEDAVLYLTEVQGSAKIWLNGKVAVERTASAENAADPLIVPLSQSGGKPGEAIRVSIRIAHSEGSGGLTRPVYVAKPTKGG